MFRGDTVKEEDFITTGNKTGEGGQGDVFILDDDFVIKRSREYKSGDKMAGNTITQTAVANNISDKHKRESNNEFARLKLCKHRHVIKVFAKTTTDKNSQIILL